jgi:hypothetical protein
VIKRPKSKTEFIVTSELRSIPIFIPLARRCCVSHCENTVSAGRNGDKRNVDSQEMKNEVSVRIQIVLICLFRKIHITAEKPMRMNAGSPAKDTPLLETEDSTVLGYHVYCPELTLSMDHHKITSRRPDHGRSSALVS